MGPCYSRDATVIFTGINLERNETIPAAMFLILSKFLVGTKWVLKTSVHSFVNMHEWMSHSWFLNVSVWHLPYGLFAATGSLITCGKYFCEEVRTTFPVPHFKVLALSQGFLGFELSLSLLVFFKDWVISMQWFCLSHYGNGTIITRPIESLHNYQKQYSNSRT